MTQAAVEKNRILTLNPIGKIQRRDERVFLVLDEAYRKALLQLDLFSHVIVLFWGSGYDTEEFRSITTTKPPYDPESEMGIFATRAEYRPNPILLTTCRIETLDVEGGVIQLENIDALDGSPVLDIKPYYPILDRVKDATVPEWASQWGEWVPEGGIGMYEESA